MGFLLTRLSIPEIRLNTSYYQMSGRSKQCHRSEMLALVNRSVLIANSHTAKPHSQAITELCDDLIQQSLGAIFRYKYSY